MSTDVRIQVVKDLANEYKRTLDQTYFCRILKRIDPLLTSNIVKLKKLRKYLRNVSQEELYSCAIIGVYAAIQESSEDQDPEEFKIRILYHVSNQIYHYLPQRRREIVVENVADSGVVDPPISESNPVLIKFLSELITRGVITQAEFVLLCRRILDGLYHKDLAKEFGMTEVGMLKKLRRIVRKIHAYNVTLRKAGKQLNFDKLQL